MAMLSVPVAKCKGGFIDIDPDLIPPEMWTEVVLQGLKSVLGRGMSKISKTTYPNEDELKAAALAKAQENAAAIMANDQKKIKLSGKATSKAASGDKATHTEAMRLARNLVKDEMKKLKLRLADYKASEITKAAQQYLENDPSIIEQAKANLAERAKVDVGSKIDLKSLISASPELVKKAEARKAKAKEDAGLSATQAGKTAVRQKPANAPAPASVQ